MIKFRCWDNEEKKFVYPVIDVTNNFYSTQYQFSRYTFDRFLFEEKGVEYYENDICLFPFENVKNRKQLMNRMCIILPLDINSHFGYEKCWVENYCSRVYNLHLHHNDDLWHKNWKYRGIPKLHEVINKLGNIHEQGNLLINEYKKTYER